MCDIAIVGGGLSGGLIALALHRERPDLTLHVIESGDALGGNHRWSWFESDLDADGKSLMAGFRKAEWDDGYDVRFPGFERHLDTPYRSLASSEFAAGLQRELPEGTILTGRDAEQVDGSGVLLDDGERIDARKVIDCRGITEAPKGLRGGWQVFLGRHMRTDKPHGVARPIIMDADVEQHGAYRFVYVLPLGAHDLFIEDTYYADSPVLDRRALSARIDEYCRSHGWEGEIIGNETGVLPVITGGDFSRFQKDIGIEGVAAAGARGGFVHPLTSYTLPQAVATAQLIAREADLPSDQLAALLKSEARRHWSATSYYRFLGKMLFGAADPGERYRIFARFYGLKEGLVERFYAGKSSLSDKARILIGKPPVSVMRAIGAILSKGAPMAKKDNR